MYNPLHIIIIILSLYLFSCTDIKTNHIGEKGYKCFDDGKCEENLKCITGNICADPCESITCSDSGKCILDNLNPRCRCDEFYKEDGLNCIPDDDNPCIDYSCKDNSTCKIKNREPTCLCNNGYINENNVCVIDTSNNTPCNGCSGHGVCYLKELDDPVCACDVGYTSGDQDGLSCVLTGTICKGGVIDYDYNNDGINEEWFEPTLKECEMYEMINYIRAVHDKEEDGLESHKPLLYSAKWSAHARNHNLEMLSSDSIFYEDYSGGQNASLGEDVFDINAQYMGCSNPKEPICKSDEINKTHCSLSILLGSPSFHCNIMYKEWKNIGIGINDGYNTQNFD